MNRSTSRRTFLRTASHLVGATALGSFLTSCGQVSSDKTVTIVYWDWYVSQAPWVDNEIQLFQKAHPNIRIKKVTQIVDKYADLFALAVKENNEPDVFMIPLKPDLPTQISNGWLKPIDGLVPSSFKSRFPQGTFFEGNNIFNGKLYSAPIAKGSPWLQLYLDNTVFRQAGLTTGNVAKLPKTWDDIINYADIITKKSNGSAYGLYIGNKENDELTWGFHMLSLAAGAPGGAWDIDFRTGKYTYASNRIYQDVLEFLLQLKRRGVTNPDALTVGDALARINFSRHKGGMTFGGIWDQGDWKTQGYTDYRMTTLIPPSGSPKAFFYTGAGGTFIAIGSQTKHPKEAGMWLDWMYSKDAGKRMVQMGEDLSVFPENDQPSVVQQNKIFSQYLEEKGLTRIGPDPAARNPDAGKVKVPSFTPSVNDVISGIWSGQISDIHGALSELEDKANAALAQGVKDAQATGLHVSLDDYIFADWDPTKDYLTKPRS